METKIMEAKTEISAILQAANDARPYNIQKSIALGEAACLQSKAILDQALIAKSLSQVSFYYMIFGDHSKAVVLANEAIAIYEDLEDEKGVADAKYTIGSVHYKSNNLHLGLKYLLDCNLIYIKHKDYYCQSKVYKSLGTIYEYFGDVESATEVYEQAILAAEICGDDNMKSNVYNPLSGIYLNKNNIEKATELITQSIILKQKTGDTRGLAFAYYGKGKILTKIQAYKEAETYYQQSIAIHIEMGEKLGLGYAYNKLGILYLEQNRFAEAIEIANKSMQLYENFNSSMIKTGATLLLYKVFDKQQKTKEALHYLKIYMQDQEENVHFQTHQIVNSYKLIQSVEAKALEDKLQLEKVEYLAKAKSDFLSKMSHEIRTPLNAVISIANLLDVNEKEETENSQLLSSLQFASNTLLSLVNNILDFSKLNAGKMELEKSTTDIRNFLQHIKNTYSCLALEKQLDLNFQIDQKIELAYAMDAPKLGQILGNLIGNAIKFTNQGNITVKVTHLKKLDHADKIRFAVIDTGSGIADDFIENIFEKFSQPKNCASACKEGSGLGLAIVKELIGLYDSQITIDTKIGTGTTFSFELILEPVKFLEPNVLKPKTSLPPVKVLLAEDNKINKMVAVKILEKWGIHPDTASDGTEALEKAMQQKYDIILMDMHMPVCNGFEATKLIKEQNGPNCITPVFAFTADITTDLDRNYDKYFDGYLHKPIELNKLYQVLENVAIPKIVIPV